MQQYITNVNGLSFISKKYTYCMSSGENLNHLHYFQFSNLYNEQIRVNENGWDKLSQIM